MSITYQCKQCDPGYPCILEFGVIPKKAPSICPYGPETPTAKWVQFDKPGPQADDEIVKAWKESYPNDRKQGIAVAQVIQTNFNNHQEAIQDLTDCMHGVHPSGLKTEIEAVRKLFRNHEKRLNAIAKTGVEMRVHKLEKERRNLERKVEELEKRLKAHKVAEAIFGELKPQPAVARATRCKDSRNVLHDLKVQRSVVSSIDHKTMLFLGTDKDGEVIVFVPDGEHDFTSGRYGYNTWAYQSSELTWLRNLDFPGGGK